MNKAKLLSVVCVIGCLLGASNTAHAINVTYDFAGTCQTGWDCGPVGVLNTTVGSVTGTMQLNLSEPTVAQLWDKDDVLSYSFIFGNFTIDNTNSTLSNSVVGNVPFTTTASAPFSLNDGFMVATYNADSSVFLNISDTLLNLVQSDPSCTGSCQAFSTGSWVRTSAVPVPAAVWLFGSGLLGLIGMARRKKG